MFDLELKWMVGEKGKEEPQPSTSFWLTVTPYLKFLSSPQPSSALKIKDGSNNFHQENIEHCLTEITPVLQAKLSVSCWTPHCEVHVKALTKATVLCLRQDNVHWKFDLYKETWQLLGVLHMLQCLWYLEDNLPLDNQILRTTGKKLKPCSVRNYPTV